MSKPCIRGKSGIADAPATPTRFAAAAGRTLALLLALTFGAMGCDDPCEKLKKKVCDDLVYYKANKQHCELLNESARRDALPAEFCTSILDSLAKR